MTQISFKELMEHGKELIESNASNMHAETLSAFHNMNSEQKIVTYILAGQTLLCCAEQDKCRMTDRENVLPPKKTINDVIATMTEKQEHSLHYIIGWILSHYEQVKGENDGRNDC